MSKKDEALKQALKAAYLAGFNASGEGYNGEYPFGACNPEKDAAWLKDRDNALQEALSEQPAKPQQEPVALLNAIRAEPTEMIHKWKVIDIIQSTPPQGIYYIPPASKPWVGLTKEEIDDLAEHYGLDCMVYEPFSRAIEVKLKEKNT